jgi:hypothetical protein
MTPVPNASGAVAALVLGILGLIFCPLCAPIAWMLGRTAEREIDAAGGSLGGRGLATAGKITGIVGTVLLVLGVLFLVIFFAVLAGSVDDARTLEEVAR